MAKVLDHGFVKLIETWGSDESIITSARMSTQKGFKGWGAKCAECSGTGIYKELDIGLGYIPVDCTNCKGKGETIGDEKLLRYLWEHKHSTPFEFAGAVFEIKAPIMVLREWQRHRVQSYTEMSARYAPLPNENYIPSIDRLMMKGGSNKQAQGTGAQLEERHALAFREALEAVYGEAQSWYEWALKKGIPKELARLVIPVGRYSKMRASANLRNWLAFLTLRNAPDAQYEIQVYAQVVQDLLKEVFPRTLALFEESLHNSELK